MSLPGRQQRVLDRIEHSLLACAPHLVSMFVMFTALTKDEAMPWWEELSSGPSPFPGRRNRSARPGRRRRTATGARAARPHATRLPAIMLVMITLLALVPAVLLGVLTRSVSSCGPAIRSQHAAPALSWRSACPPGPGLLAYQRLMSG
jgi:hypothetical protein